MRSQPNCFEVVVDVVVVVFVVLVVLNVDVVFILFLILPLILSMIFIDAVLNPIKHGGVQRACGFLKCF